MKASATDVKNSFGKYLKKCTEEDIYITKNDKIVAKLVNYSDAGEGTLFVTESNAAYNYSGKRMSYEEFINLTEDIEERYEFIEGEIYLLASPGVNHQVIHSNLYKKLLLWFDGKKCQVFSAPFDVTLYNVETNSKNVVQPDLLVTCDHRETTNEKDRYMGIPSLVIEIVSKHARSRDLVTKLNVYLEGGINEYWIIDPQKKQVLQYYFADKQDCQLVVYRYQDILKSFHFEGLEIDVSEIFA